MDIKKILKLHSEWLQDSDTGERADLSCANLSCANLSRANFLNANLSWVNFLGANLSLADLSCANLRNVIGNDREIKNIKTPIWRVAYTKKILQIGCENHTIEEWKSFTDDEVNAMDCEALEWSKEWFPVIFETIERDPSI